MTKIFGRITYITYKPLESVENLKIGDSRDQPCLFLQTTRYRHQTSFPCSYKPDICIRPALFLFLQQPYVNIRLGFIFHTTTRCLDQISLVCFVPTTTRCIHYTSLVCSYNIQIYTLDQPCLFLQQPNIYIRPALFVWTNNQINKFDKPCLFQQQTSLPFSYNNQIYTALLYNQILTLDQPGWFQQQLDVYIIPALFVPTTSKYTLDQRCLFLQQ